MGKCHHGHGVGDQTRLLETACRNASEQAGVDTKVEQVKHSRGNGSGEVAQSESSTGQHRLNIPLCGKNWSEHERAEIGRLEAVCSGTDH